MLVNIDLGSISKGRITDLTKRPIRSLERNIKSCSIHTFDSVDAVRSTIVRTGKGDSSVDTIYMENREDNSILGYIELRYGRNRYEVYASPYLRDLEPKALFELE